MLREARTEALVAALDAEKIPWSAYRHEFTLVRGSKSVLVTVNGSTGPGYRIDKQTSPVNLAYAMDVIRRRLAGESD